MRLASVFRRSNASLTPSQIIRWWELRRLLFNLIVGVAGLLTCFICVLSDCLPDPPIFAVLGIVVYALAANLCYTFGWVAEIVAVAFWKTRASSFGEISFALGIFFSALLTLLPIPIFVLGALIRWGFYPAHP